MWVSATLKEWLVGALGAFIVFLSVYTHHRSHQAGITKGIDSYHDMCSTVGGYVIDEQGRVVSCSGLTQIPQQELPLDRKKTI